MRIGIIGRTKNLLDTAQALIEAGHVISFIYTCKSEPHYGVTEKDFEKMANDLGCPFFNGLDIQENKDQLLGTGVDICVSVNWSSI